MTDSQGRILGDEDGQDHRRDRAGVDFAALAANTPHIVFGGLRARSPVPLISIVEDTCEAARGRGLKRVGLFFEQMKAQDAIEGLIPGVRSFP